MDDVCKRLDVVVLQMQIDPKASAQGGGQEPTTSRGAHECEGIEVDLYGACAGTFIQHDVDAVVLHSRVEVFLHDGTQAVDLIDEEHVIGLKRCKKPS